MRFLTTSALLGGLLLTSQGSYSQTINFQIGATNTSGSTAVGNIITEGLNKRGYKVSFIALGNCALSRKQFEDATSPMLTIWQNSYNSQRAPACNLEIKPENVVSMIFEIPYSVCATSNKTFEDYMKKGSSHNIGVMSQSVPYNTLLKSIEQKQGNTHNILVYKNAVEITAAGKSKEIELVLMNTDAAEQAGFKCLFTLSDSKHIPRARDLWPDNPINSAGALVWLMQKNMTTAQVSKLSKDISDIYREKEWQDLNRVRGYSYGLNLNVQEVIGKINKDREISIYD